MLFQGPDVAPAGGPLPEHDLLVPPVRYHADTISFSRRRLSVHAECRLSNVNFYGTTVGISNSNVTDECILEGLRGAEAGCLQELVVSRCYGVTAATFTRYVSQLSW